MAPSETKCSLFFSSLLVIFPCNPIIHFSSIFINSKLLTLHLQQISSQRVHFTCSLLSPLSSLLAPTASSSHFIRCGQSVTQKATLSLDQITMTLHWLLFTVNRPATISFSPSLQHYYIITHWFNAHRSLCPVTLACTWDSPRAIKMYQKQFHFTCYLQMRAMVAYLSVLHFVLSLYDR